MSRNAVSIARVQAAPAPAAFLAAVPVVAPTTRTADATPQLAPLLALLARDHELGVRGMPLVVDAAPFRQRPAAAAAAANGRVWLHPRLFDRQGRAAPQARRLLIHELVHLRQQQGPATARAGRAAAELEAERIAQRVAQGRRAPRVRLALPAAALAFDEDFDATVRLRYGAEIARIKRLLRGVWGFLWVTDGMVEEILVILQSLDYVSAVSLLAGASTTGDENDAITRREREKLLGELSDTHRRRYRLQVLALYAALDDDTLRQADAELFNGMDLSHLRPEEHASLQRLLGLLPEAVVQALRDDEQRGDAVRQILGHAAAFDAEAARERIAERLETERAARLAAGRPAETDAELAAVFGGDERLAAVFVQIQQALTHRINDRERLVALDQLSPWMGEPDQLQTVVLRLQANPGPGRAEGEDLFERWLDGFPVESLYQPPEDAADAPADGQRRLGVLLRLLQFRDPWRNAQLARELATQSWFLDIINDEEAWLALQLIGVLPQAMQDRLLEDLGPTIWSNLSASQRESAGANFYRGGAGGRDLASIQTQLLDPQLWTAPQAGRLSGLIRMAIAARQHEWVFGLSQQRHEQQPDDYRDADFIARVVEPFQLYNPEAVGADGLPAPREQYRPEYLESVSAGAEVGEFFSHVPIVGGLIHGLGVLGEGIALAAGSRSISLSDGIGAEGVNVAQLQGMEHLLRFLEVSFYGVRFADQASLGAEGAAASESRRGVNFVDRVRYRDGIFEMRANNLAIAAIHSPFGSLVIQGGPGRLSGVDLRVASGVAAPQLGVTATSIVLDNLLIVRPGDMLSVNRIEIDDLDIRVGEEAAGSWLIAPLFQAAALAQGQESAGSSLAAPDAPTPLELRFGAVRLHGLTTSGGRYVDSIDLRRVSIGIGGDRATYMERLWTSFRDLTHERVTLQRRIERSEDPAERAELQPRLDRLTALRESVHQLYGSIAQAEVRVNELQQRRERGDALSPEDEQQLRDDQAFLARFDRGGAVLDIGELHIRGVAGDASLEALDLTDVHGMGTSATALLGLLSPSDVLPRILQGESFRPEVLEGRDARRSDFALDLGTLDLRGLTLRSAVPTVEEARQELAQASERRTRRPWDRQARLAEELAQARLDDTEAYARLAAIGVSHLSPADRELIRALHERLSSREAFYAAHLRSEGTRLTLGDSGRGIGLHADRLDAFRAEDGSAGLRAGGYEIGELHGRQIDVSTDIEGGLLGVPEDAASLRERLRRLGMSGESLEILDFRDTGSDFAFDRAVLEGFDLRADREAGSRVGSGDEERTLAGTVDAQATLARIEGLRSDVTEEGLLAQIASLEEKPEALRTDAENTRLEAVRLTLDTFRGFVDLIAELEHRRSEGGTPAQHAEAETLLAATLDQFALWRRSLGMRTGEVHDLSLRVSGLGDVASSRFDLDRALASGLLIEGTGSRADGSRSDRLFSSAELTDARFGVHSAGRVSAGETAGRIYASRDEVRIENLAIARLELGDFYLEAGGNQVWNANSSVATGITVTGSLHFADSAEHPGDRYLSRVQIAEFGIATLEGNGLSAWIASKQAMVQVESGVIGQIWVRALDVQLPEQGEMSIHGEAGIRSLTDVRVNGMVEGALEFGRARLNGSELSIGFLESGGERINIGDLSLDEGQFRTADGHIRVSARHVSGVIEHHGSVWTLRDVRVPQIELQQLHWRSGTRTFTVEQPAVLSGLRVTATVDTAVEGDLALHITHLHADGLVGQHFRYDDPPLTVEVRQLTPWTGATSNAAEFSRPAIEVGAIDVHDLDWSQRGSFTAGTVDVASVHAAVNVLKDQLDMGALVDTGAIHVGFRRDGLDVSAEDIAIETDGTLSGRDSPLTGRNTLHAGATGGRTGLVRFYDDRIEAPELYFERLVLHELDFESADYRVSVPEFGGEILLEQVAAAVTVELDPEAEAMTPTRIVIHSLDVPTVTAAGISLVLKAVDVGGTPRDVTIRLPNSPPATATNLHVGAANPLGEGFVLTPRFNAVTGQTEWLRDGAVGLGTLDANALGVEIQGLMSLRTDAHVETLSLGLLSSGDWSLDVLHTELSQLTADIGANHVEITGIPPHLSDQMSGGSPNVTIGGLHRGTGGEWSADEVGVSGLAYRNTGQGVAVEIASARLPSGFERPASGPLTLPSLAIDDAWFRINDLTALMGPSSGEPTPIENLRFLDALHGTVTLNVSITNIPDIDVTLHIQPGGIVELSEIEGETAGYDPLVDFDYDEDSRQLVLNLDWGNAIGVIPAMIPQANKALTTWSGLDEEEDELARAGKSRLSTLVGRREPGAEDDDGEPDTFRVDQIYGIDAQLTMDATPLPLGDYGTLQLGTDDAPAAEGIHVTGSVGEMSTQLQIAIERLSAHTDPAAPLQFGSSLVGIGNLTVENIHDTTLDFRDFKPHAFEGRIGSASAENITVE